MNKLCYVATIPAVVHSFLREHILAAAEKFEVTVVCNSTDIHLLAGIKARIIQLPIERKPSPWKDALILVQLFRLFQRERFDIVHTHMPKTALLGMLAAWIARIPIRINTFHGEVWATRSGWRRATLKLFDRLIGSLATVILAVSPSQKKFLESQGVLPPGKAMVIGAGSICGVDPRRFHPDGMLRNSVRNELGIAQDATVILYVGRLNRDKGILDLATAFNVIAKFNPNVLLLLVGSEEDVSFNRILEICDAVRDRVQHVNFTSMPERYMASADIYCLPSYREGFGMTIVEAAGCAVPTVASRIYGITDAVADGQTGLLFPVGDVAALTSTLQKLIAEKDLRQRMGNAARMRAMKLFSSEKIIHETIMMYDRLLEERGNMNDKVHN